MSGDIHRVGAATHHMVEFAATLVVIAAQIIIAFVIAPLFDGRSAVSDRDRRSRGICHAAASA